MNSDIKSFEPVIGIISGLVSMGWPGLIAGIVIIAGLAGAYIFIFRLRNKAAKRESDAIAAKSEAGNTAISHEIENKQKEAEGKVSEVSGDMNKKERPSGNLN